MKRLLVLTSLCLMTASAVGCARWSARGAPCQPCVPVASPCAPQVIDPYASGATVTTVPSLAPTVAVPTQTQTIGPEQYTPAGP